MRSMVEGFSGVWRTPPPAFGWSPSPGNPGEDIHCHETVIFMQ